MIRILELEDALKNETNPVARSAIQGEINNQLLAIMQEEGLKASDALMAVRALRQPAPTNETKGYEGSVLEFITKNAKPSPDVDKALKLLTDRAKFGYEKYGTYLHPHNGRSALIDLRDELLDAQMYVMQFAMEEGTAELTDDHATMMLSVPKALGATLRLLQTRNAK